MQYRPVDPDFHTSPRTGLTRRHWKECGIYLVEQMFSSLSSMEAPLLFRKVPGKSYPEPDAPPARIRAAEFEGFVRSLNLVAPLMQEDPDLAVRGVRLLDYYRRELLALIRPESGRSVPLLSSFKDGDHNNQQMTCEWGGLSAILLLYPRLWDSLEPADRDLLAAQLHDYAHERTSGHNWRYFNIMMMLFLRQHGYPVTETVWESHMDALLALDAGEGWYRDAHFDYYNAWVFHLYAPVWCRFYGYDHAPEIAALMERQSRELMAGYPFMFARNGHMLMWGRSIAYRTGAISPIPAAFNFRNPPPLDPGWARRLCSGNLLQFAGRDDFLENGVPALGFYGHFEPAIQCYSCAASPMWGHLNFLAAFSLPADHSFWTAHETDGDWETVSRNTVRETVVRGPGFCLTNYGTSGHTELRSGKAEPDDPNYNRLGFHTAFPWEALDPLNGMAMHYTRRTDNPITGEGYQMPVKVYWCGYERGILYRQLNPSHFAMGTPAAIDLADVALPDGVLRIDRPRLYLSGVLRLCHYGLPHVNGAGAIIERRQVRGCNAIIARIPGRQLALVTVSGWDRVDAVSHTGFNPEAEESTLLFAEWNHAERFPALKPKIALLLHKCDDSPWTDEELMPVQSWESPRISELGIYGVRLKLNDGRRLAVNFTAFEGRKQD